jgi:hypothetical protein
VLKAMLRRKLKDPKLLELLDRIIDHPVPGGAVRKGIPIGNLTSQYFANIYLCELDHYIKTQLRIKGYVRYMDDFLLLANDKPLLHETLAAIRTFLHDVLQLRLKDEVTRIAPVTQGVTFVGFRIFPGTVRLDRRKWAGLKREIRAREMQYACGMIDEENLAQSVASMIGHMSHADTLEARRTLFAESLVWG